jgi:hypothetical protein
MTVYKGKLYAPGSPSSQRLQHHDWGRVFCFEAGKNVTYDDDLGSEWRHLAAVREKHHLKLYVDGKLYHTSSPFEPKNFDIANEKPLLIGFGARNYFTGAMDDLRIYRGVLNESQIRTLGAMNR